MNVAIFGVGYVGLVTGACLAEVGHRVDCIDIDRARIDGLNRGHVPIHEPGLAPLVRQNLASGRLAFHVDVAHALKLADIVFIAVGTPSDEDGSADLKHVLAAARAIGEHIEHPVVVVNKSTVPVGTADRVDATIAEVLARRGLSIRFQVLSNPEFLKEGAAVEDCMRPDRIVIGGEDPAAIESLRRLYAPFNRNHDRVITMDARSSELTKYAANAMLATKISFMNEIANIAEKVGADVEMVRRGIGSDPRIGWHFIYPGAGYGGSCFPKDVRALARTAADSGHAAELLAAVETVNDRQKHRLFELVEGHFRDRGGVRGRTFALWGLAFKPDTDDMREASSRPLLERLLASGARVRAYDPEAGREASRLYGQCEGLSLCASPDEALAGADALVLVTEWKQFRSPDFRRLSEALAAAVIFDGRNVYNPREVEEAGIAYYGIGRGRSIQKECMHEWPTSAGRSGTAPGGTGNAAGIPGAGTVRTERGLERDAA